MSFTLFWYFETDGKAHIKHFGNPIPGPATPHPPPTHREVISRGSTCALLVENWTGWIVSVKHHFYLKGQAVIIQTWLFCIWKIISCRLMQWACHFQDRWQHFLPLSFQVRRAVWENVYLLLRAGQLPRHERLLMRSVSVNECALRCDTMKVLTFGRLCDSVNSVFPGTNARYYKVTHE